REEMVSQVRGPPHVRAGVAAGCRRVAEHQVGLQLEQHEHAARDNHPHTDQGFQSAPQLLSMASRRRRAGVEGVAGRAGLRGARRNHAVRLRLEATAQTSPVADRTNDLIRSQGVYERLGANVYSTRFHGSISATPLPDRDVWIANHKGSRIHTICSVTVILHYRTAWQLYYRTS